MSKKRILSGMRPSGKLHLGHLFGALNNWVKLQDEYECYYMVADWHALTTDYADTSKVQDNIREMVIDFLTVGLDPAKSVIFKQSDVFYHAELHLILSMITPLGLLFRCPTYKEQLKEVQNKDLHNYGFLGYPVLQAADILVYKASAVPVGEDQLPHLELTREVARKFNGYYGEVLIEPKGLLTQSARLPGIDNRKMSKSYGNAITLSETPEEVDKKVRQMFTDPLKIRANDLGHPEGCVVFAFHKIYNPNCQARETECKEGKIGCVACKKELINFLNISLAPMIEKRNSISKDKNFINDVLNEGKKKALKTAGETMEQVRKALKI
jgi:tryptophanyl-tRNA synthetase